MQTKMDKTVNTLCCYPPRGYTAVRQLFFLCCFFVVETRFLFRVLAPELKL